MKQTILVSIFNLFFAAMLNAQSFTNYTTDDGMLVEDILCMDIDGNDNLWLGTAQGLSKFDGETWTHYTPEIYLNLVPSAIQVAFVASDDKVWLGTKNGISVFNGEDFISYTTRDGLGSNQINHITEDAFGTIWIGESKGVTKYDGLTFNAFGASEGLPLDGVAHIGFDADGDLLLSSMLRGTVRYDAMTLESLSASSKLLFQPTRAMALDAQNNQWLGTEEGLMVVDASGRVVNHEYDALVSSEAEVSVQDLLVDAQEKIWVAHKDNASLSMYDGSTWTTYDDSDGLIGTTVRQLAVDSENNIWVATNAGLSKITTVEKEEDNGLQFEIFPNPVVSYLNLKFKPQSELPTRQIEIYTTNMQQIISITVDGSEEDLTIPVGALSNGIYFVRVGQEMMKFLISK